MTNKFSLPGFDLMKGMGIGPLNIGNVLDTMGFVKKAWGAMNAPAAFAPTMDLEELDRRIAGLQSVEQWLNMNQSMIQGSIQALEVQRATIATLRDVTKGMMPMGLNLPNMNGATEALQQMAAMTGVAGLPSSQPTQSPSKVATRYETTAVDPTPKASTEKGTSSTQSIGVEPGLSATAWLEFLQGQFNQVAQAAMSGAALKGVTQIAKDSMDKAMSVAQTAVPSSKSKKAIPRAPKKARTKSG